MSSPQDEEVSAILDSEDFLSGEPPNLSNSLHALERHLSEQSRTLINSLQVSNDMENQPPLVITPRMIWNHVKRHNYCTLDTKSIREAVVYEDIMFKMDMILFFGALIICTVNKQQLLADFFKYVPGPFPQQGKESRLLDSFFIISITACLFQVIKLGFYVFNRWANVTKDFLFVTSLLFVYIVIYMTVCSLTMAGTVIKDPSAWVVLMTFDYCCFALFIYRGLDPHSVGKHVLFVLAILGCTGFHIFAMLTYHFKHSLKKNDFFQTYKAPEFITGKFLLWCIVGVAYLWRKFNCCLPHIPTAKNNSLFDFIITYRCFLLLPLSMYSMQRRYEMGEAPYERDLAGGMWVTISGFYVMTCSAFLLAPLSNGDCENVQEVMKRGALEFDMDLCLKCYDLSLNIYYAVRDGLIHRIESSGETWFHVFRFDDTLFIVFRGTGFESSANVKTDLDIWREDLNEDVYKKELFGDKKDYRGVKVHRGFQTAYLQVHAMIHEKIKLHCEGNENIVISGHSLGGAIAQLCALDLKLQRPERNIDMYLFATPKVGNRRFAKLMNNRFPKNYYRIIMEGDPANNYPQLGGYVQAGTECWINKQGEMEFNMGHMRKWVMPYSFKIWNHSMQAYADALALACRTMIQKGDFSTDDDETWRTSAEVQPYFSNWPVQIQGWMHNLRGVMAAT